MITTAGLKGPDRLVRQAPPRTMVPPALALELYYLYVAGISRVAAPPLEIRIVAQEKKKRKGWL